MTNEQMGSELMQARRDIAALLEQMKAAFKRIDEQKALADSVHVLALAVERHTAELAQRSRDYEELHKDVEELKQKPSKRWDLVVTGLIGAAVAVVGQILFNTK